MSTNGVGKNVVIWFNPVEKTWLMVWSHIASPGHKNFFVLSDIFCRTSFVRMHACLESCCMVFQYIQNLISEKNLDCSSLRGTPASLFAGSSSCSQALFSGKNLL